MGDLRDLLERESERVSFPVRRVEAIVERAARRERRRRATALSVGVVVAILAAAIVFSILPRGDRSHRVAHLTITPEHLAGDYLTHVRPGAADARAQRFAGLYRIRIFTDGTLQIVAPRRVDVPGGAARLSIDADGRVRTTLFDDWPACRGKGDGTYEVELLPRSVRFATVHDDCFARRTVLASSAWTRSTAQGTDGDPLRGTWTSAATCEQMVRTVAHAPVSQADGDRWRAAIPTMWGAPPAPARAHPCAGAPASLHSTFRFSASRVQIFDGAGAEGFDARYTLQGNTFTLTDGRDRNIIGTYRCSFVRTGDRLRIHLLGRAATDPFFVATWESAPLELVGPAP